jgi:2-oxopent-4-enoate/cis-2-oxohex-4-enoate hydratase
MADQERTTTPRPGSAPMAATPPDRRDPWDVPAVVAGMEKLLARRQELLDEGAVPIGWKLAFGTEAAMSKLGTTGPLVGFLTDATLLDDDAECSIAGWTAPKLEPEIAIHLGPGGEGVAGISAAIELADADLPPTETETVLAGDIYHRAVVLDRIAPPAPLVHPVAARIECDGAREIAATEDAEAEVGRIEDLAAWTVTYLRHFGIATAAGEVIISGAVVPLLDIAPGQHLRNRIEGVGELSVYITT